MIDNLVTEEETCGNKNMVQQAHAKNNIDCACE